MILTKLEGTILTGEDELGIYEDYLESHRSLFLFKTFEYMNTPIRELLKKGVNTSGPSSYSLTLIDSYTNFLVVGKLHSISSNYYNIGQSVYKNTDTLMGMLKNKGYDIKRLAKSLVDLFLESYLEKIKFHLNKGTLVEITNMYNTTTYERSKK